MLKHKYTLTFSLYSLIYTAFLGTNSLSRTLTPSPSTMAIDQFKGQPRLPKFALPKRYDIKLNPDLVSCKFSGLVSIDVDVVSPTKFLVLNAADLDIDSKSLSFIPNSTSQVFLSEI